MPRPPLTDREIYVMGCAFAAAQPHWTNDNVPPVSIGAWLARLPENAFADAPPAPIDKK